MSFLILAGVAGGALLTFAARHYLRDDALIHVRAAGLLLQTGMSRSFVDSSPAFLFLTAAGYWLTGSIFVPKALSIAGFAALVALLAHRAWSEKGGGAQTLYVAYLLLAVSPFGILWLTDGMETSLCVVLVLALAHVCPRPSPVARGVLAFLCVVTRVELAALVAVAVLADLVRRRRYSAVAGMLGGSAALIAIGAFFGSILPDASFAKARFDYGVLNFVVLLASVAGGAGTLGIGLVVIWFGVVIANVRRLYGLGRADRESVALLAGIASLPIMLVATMVRGQAVEGIRPLLPFLAFSVSCATRLYGRLQGGSGRNGAVLVALLPAMIAAMAAVDWTAFDRIIRTQDKALVAMRDKDWSWLHGHPGLGWDVGYLAQFSGAPICDVQGLVNGRRFSRLTQEQRLESCVQIAEFAFVDQTEFNVLAASVDLSHWRICDRFRFAKRTESFLVYLLVVPALAVEPYCSREAPAVGGSGVVDLSSIDATLK